MHATIRRYEGVDQNRMVELTNKVNESLMPRLSKMPGFGGYYLIEAKDGVMTSVGLFETSEQGDESSRIAAEWVREKNLDAAFPTPPRVTAGEVVVHEINGVRA